jgi:CHAD domain-containing protein
MNGNKLFDRWRQRYLGWLKRQDVLVRRAREQGDAVSVHDLRVTVRRLRLMVRLAAPFVGRKTANRYRTWSRAISDATSAMRDLDVILEWLVRRPDAAEVTRRVVAERQRVWEVRRSGLQPMPGGLSQKLRQFRADAKARRRFARRYDNRFARLFQRIQPQARRYARMPIEERHAFRRQLRQLRYLRELALARRKQPQDPVLERLVRPQVAMGELQNLQLVEARLKQHSPSALLVKLTRELSLAQARQSREIRLGLKSLAQRSPLLGGREPLTLGAAHSTGGTVLPLTVP